MTTQQLVKIATGAVLALGMISLVERLSTSPTVEAQGNGNNDEEQSIRIGYAIAPVPLNLTETGLFEKLASTRDRRWVPRDRLRIRSART
jgi:hypothetical protein